MPVFALLNTLAPLDQMEQSTRMSEIHSNRLDKTSIPNEQSGRRVHYLLREVSLQSLEKYTRGIRV